MNTRISIVLLLLPLLGFAATGCQAQKYEASFSDLYLHHHNRIYHVRG